MAWWLCLFGFALCVSKVLTEGNGPLNFKFHQTDYHVKIEWGEAVRYNKRCFKQFEFTAFKFNRTCTAFNLTYDSNWNIGKDLEVIFQAYKFASNEYRQFPLRFEINFCTAMANNIGGMQRFFTCGNFTECSVLKDARIRVCNFVPDQSELPPFVPNGRYKVDLQGLYHDEEVFLIDVHLEVYRPLKGN